MEEKSNKQKNSFNIYKSLFPFKEIVKIDCQSYKVEDWQQYINSMNA
jgi:hypothetical protein